MVVSSRIAFGVAALGLLSGCARVVLLEDDSEVDTSSAKASAANGANGATTSTGGDASGTGEGSGGEAPFPAGTGGGGGAGPSGDRCGSLVWVEGEITTSADPAVAYGDHAALLALADGTASALFASHGDTRRNVDIRSIGNAWQGAPRFTGAQPTRVRDLPYVTREFPTAGATTAAGATWIYAIHEPAHEDDRGEHHVAQTDVVVDVLGGPRDEYRIGSTEGASRLALSASGQAVRTWPSPYSSDRLRVRLDAPVAQEGIPVQIEACYGGHPFAADVLAVGGRFAVGYATAASEGACDEEPVDEAAIARLATFSADGVATLGDEVDVGGGIAELRLAASHDDLWLVARVEGESMMTVARASHDGAIATSSRIELDWRHRIALATWSDHLVVVDGGNQYDGPATPVRARVFDRDGELMLESTAPDVALGLVSGLAALGSPHDDGALVAYTQGDGSGVRQGMMRVECAGR